MANPADNRDPADRNNSTGVRPSFAAQNSTVRTRAKKQTMQKFTLAAILLCFCLALAMLAIMLIGGIIAKSSDTDKGQDQHNMEWGEKSVAMSDTLQGPLVLVNNEHAYTFPSTEAHLAEIYSVYNRHKPHLYQQSGISAYMEKTALDALDIMLTDFATQSGNKQVQIRDAYRDLKTQENYGVDPGHSDHHTGYGCVLRYVKDGGSGETHELAGDLSTYGWILEHCHEYGFITRYPTDKADKTGVEDYESYFRYVGVAHATYMKEADLCMEEYVEFLKTKTYKKPLNIKGADGKDYCVYYAEVSSGGSSIHYPTNYAYTMSGTNEGGVVITVNLSEPVTASTAD